MSGILCEIHLEQAAAEWIADHEAESNRLRDDYSTGDNPFLAMAEAAFLRQNGQGG